MELPSFNTLKVRIGLALLFLFAFTSLARAEMLMCDLCGKPLIARFYTVEDKVEGKQKRICEACEKIESKCFICGLPVRDNFKRLPDGRFICARELKTIIESETEAKSICGTVKYDVDRLLSRYLTLPGDNIQLSIVDRYRLDNLFSAPGSESACVSVYGATSTHITPDGKFVHTVDILSHLQKPRLMAVCAHEYTHAWMGENVSNKRHKDMDKNTIEGFCELMAYKYMDSIHEEGEMENIKKNTYTRGQILVLIEADKKYGFNTVMDWVKDGEDETITMDNLDRIRALKDHVVARASVSEPGLIYGTAPIVVPTTLMLKSISGSAQRRFALINSTTFEANEKEHVRVGNTNLSVRCLEIRNDSVIIQVGDSPEKQQLYLREK